MDATFAQVEDVVHVFVDEISGAYGFSRSGWEFSGQARPALEIKFCKSFQVARMLMAARWRQGFELKDGCI